MGTFDNLYLNQIKKLQEENIRLKGLLKETTDDTSPKFKLNPEAQLPRIYAAWEDVNKKRGGKARQLTRQEVRLLAFHADGLMDDMLRNIINRRVSDFDNLDRD